MTTAQRFFIVGAPKCGTSALAAWLAGHPGIFMTPHKEPHFYARDLGDRAVTSAAAYRRLYGGARGARIAGEASTWYLYSQRAVPDLLDDHPDARLIVCLREPAAMAISLHDQHLRSGNEDVADFARAWRLQSERARGRRIPGPCREPAVLQYAAVCSLGSQLARLIDNAGRARVLPLLLDDLRADPGAAYRQVLAHLGVADDGRGDFPVVNPAATPRVRWLQRGLRSAGRLRRALGVPAPGTGLSQAVSRLNQRPRAAPAPDPHMRALLAQYFSDEVDQLAALLGRDLSAWQAPATEAGA